MSEKTYPRVLSIAGSDCSGGAGIQADIKTVSACGAYAMSAVTAVVDENTVGVTGVWPVPPEFVCGQIRSCLEDIGADAIKIGMLGTPELVRAVAKQLAESAQGIPVVLDPVMVAQSGDRLVGDDAAMALRAELLPMAAVITPNLPEASVLLERPIRRAEDLREGAAELCRRFGCAAALVKGGHLEEGEDSDDLLYEAAGGGRWVAYPGERIPTRNNHGTGCTLSSAIAAHLALGHPLEEAVRRAKAYITGAIWAGAEYRVGKGHGPVHHFWQWY
jgi:hydroxymethylpyrimidine/phosphomethylpyrimidine kinase